LNDDIVGFSNKEVEVFSDDSGGFLYVQEYPRGTWALTDPAFGETHIRLGPGNLLGIWPHLFTIFTTEPFEVRYKDFVKQRRAEVLVMNPFSWKEFEFFA
jgi:hypothetical protein